MAQVIANNPAGSYTFASQPRAVQQRKKYKDPWNAPSQQYEISCYIICFCLFVLKFCKN